MLSFFICIDLQYFVIMNLGFVGLALSDHERGGAESNGSRSGLIAQLARACD